MRTRIVHEGARHLEYEIRQILAVGREFESHGVEMMWENIGDPIAMGERVAPWIQEYVRELLNRHESWGYCQTLGVPEARAFLAEKVNERGGVRVSPDDILFVNGIADAVDKVYDLVRRDARVLTPSPCYPTHSSNEHKRGDYSPLTYRLDPRNGWLPDLDEISALVRYNPQVIAISLVNPDNPTGLVYPRKVLEDLVEIARQNRLFLVSDEIYAHIVYNGAGTVHLSEVLGDVPGLALRGISKEYPWPGARCGWIEMLNRHTRPEFAEYCQALVNAKMMEVCATTLPQMSIPPVMGDARYLTHLRDRAERFALRAREAHALFAPIDGVTVHLPQGAFYFTVVFDEGVLHAGQSLPVGAGSLRDRLREVTRDVPADKHFVYHLMASAGICVTPLSGFHCPLPGFRITLLQADDVRRRATLAKLAEAVRSYLESGTGR